MGARDTDVRNHKSQELVWWRTEPTIGFGYVTRYAGSLFHPRFEAAPAESPVRILDIGHWRKQTNEL